jgi:beta-glucosidase
VTNEGRRAGTAVVQAYLQYPKAADEPPEQLRAFDAVPLQPHQSSLIHLTLPASAFQAYLHGGFRTLPGTYSINIGQSSASLPIHLATNAPS